jgi:hypothetical protein
MSHYVLRVYTQAGYRPDLGLRSSIRARAERRARRLQREGFRTRVVAERAPRGPEPALPPTRIAGEAAETRH